MLEKIKNLIKAELDFALECFSGVKGIVGSEDDLRISQQIQDYSGFF